MFDYLNQPATGLFRLVAGFIFVSILATIGFISALREAKTKKLTNLASDQKKDEALDYVLRYYQLDLPNPYVVKPGFSERRCHHCHHPEGFGHHFKCPWLHLKPLTDVLYGCRQKDGSWPKVI